MKNLKRYWLGELARTYASDKDNVVCRAYDVEKLEALHAELLDAAKAIVERWDTPHWKFAEHTGVYIERLRAAITKATGAQP